MAEFVVRLEEQPELELDTLDVGVEENVIAFDITGTIRDLDDNLLAELTDSTLRPTEIHFTTDE
ncbi:hypothetical protein [Haladaptatus sp. CMAA 1911]|uniref:hypothetical protein n=1 Tax=unclassified Haladaptatus TaxID=2622732 RepID=UPI0037552232